MKNSKPTPPGQAPWPPPGSDLFSGSAGYGYPQASICETGWESLRLAVRT